jgi:hypothetical protein
MNRDTWQLNSGYLQKSTKETLKLDKPLRIIRESMNVSGPGFGSRKEAENLLFPEKSKPVLQPTQASIQWAPESFPGGKEAWV